MIVYSQASLEISDVLVMLDEIEERALPVVYPVAGFESVASLWRFWIERLWRDMERVAFDDGSPVHKALIACREAGSAIARDILGKLEWRVMQEI